MRLHAAELGHPRGGVAVRPRPALRRGGQHRQVPGRRRGVPRRRSGHADPRRLGLRAGVPRRALLAGGPADADRAGQPGDGPATTWPSTCSDCRSRTDGGNRVTSMVLSGRSAAVASRLVGRDLTGERPVGVDQTHESVIVAEEVVVKWLHPPVPAPHPGAELLAYLTAQGYTSMPAFLGVVEHDDLVRASSPSTSRQPRRMGLVRRRRRRLAPRRAGVRRARRVGAAHGRDDRRTAHRARRSAAQLGGHPHLSRPCARPAARGDARGRGRPGPHLRALETPIQTRWNPCAAIASSARTASTAICTPVSSYAPATYCCPERLRRQSALRRHRAAPAPVAAARPREPAAVHRPRRPHRGEAPSPRS